MTTEKQVDRFLDVLEDIASSLQQLIPQGSKEVKFPSTTSKGDKIRAVREDAVKEAMESIEERSAKKPAKKKEEKAEAVEETEEVEAEEPAKKPAKKAKKKKETGLGDVKSAAKKLVEAGIVQKIIIAAIDEEFGVKKLSALTADQYDEALELFGTLEADVD